jgi:DNA-binding helix-turn-helix protein|nr:MAG TPA: helix-turn-helix domain protein [Caudoviricetes sp.]
MLNVPKIKGRMREMKWTQESLAKEMGINPTTINYKINNEKGEFLTIEEAEKLKNLLKIPKEELNEYFFYNKT